MATKIEVDWTTGPNITGFYSGTETMIIDGDDFDVYEIEEMLLRQAARKLCWNGKLKRVNTVISRA